MLFVRGSLPALCFAVPSRADIYTAYESALWKRVSVSTLSGNVMNILMIIWIHKWSTFPDRKARCTRYVYTYRYIPGTCMPEVSVYQVYIAAVRRVLVPQLAPGTRTYPEILRSILLWCGLGRPVQLIVYEYHHHLNVLLLILRVIHYYLLVDVYLLIEPASMCCQ